MLLPSAAVRSVDPSLRGQPTTSASTDPPPPGDEPFPSRRPLPFPDAERAAGGHAPVGSPAHPGRRGGAHSTRSLPGPERGRVVCGRDVAEPEPQLLRPPADDLLVGGTGGSVSGQRGPSAGEVAVHRGVRGDDVAAVPSGRVPLRRARRPLGRGRPQSQPVLLAGGRRLGAARRAVAALRHGRGLLPGTSDAGGTRCSRKPTRRWGPVGRGPGSPSERSPASPSCRSITGASWCWAAAPSCSRRARASVGCAGPSPTWRRPSPRRCSHPS